MKAELKLVPHAVLKDADTIEVWHAGQFICSIYGADGPGVRIVTKHGLKVAWVDPLVLEVMIDK